MNNLRPWTAPAIIALVTLAAFSPVLRNELLFDDFPNLVENPHYRGIGWTQLQWMFTTLFNGHYRPLTWITFGPGLSDLGHGPLRVPSDQSAYPLRQCGAFLLRRSAIDLDGCV